MSEGAARSRRLPSLDLLRGLTVLGMIVVNATAGVAHRDGPVFAALLHSDWAGFTIADAVFPAFIVMLGVSVTLSSARSGGTLPILARAGRLILLGLLLSNIFWLYDMSEYHPRLPGVLQRIGIVYGATALLYRKTGWRMRAIVAVVILLLYWPLCLLRSPDGMATSLWIPGHNIVSWTDRVLLGPFRFVQGPQGYDPEGLLGALPTFAEALIGTLAGDWLRRGSPPGESWRAMVIAALAMVVVGLGWGLVFPIVKNLWTSSFVLLSAGIALLALAGFHAMIDGQGESGKRGGLLGSFGRNAIAAYALHELTAFILTSDAMQWPFHALAPMAGTRWAALAPVLIFTGLVWWPIAAMDRRGWHWRI